MTEKQKKLLAAVEDADVVILLSEKGQAGMTFFKGIGTVPSNVEIDYGEKDDPPLTIRRVSVRAGWTAKDWKAMDRTGLHSTSVAKNQKEGPDVA